MERYHIYKLGLAILFYMVYCGKKSVVNGLKLDDVTSASNTTDYRERRDSGDDTPYSYQADGTPGIDYPTLSYVPRTKFSCRDQEAGYYADLETNCQVFHICDEGRKLSFLCPNGTIFQQAELICDWWFKVNCSTSPLLYEESAEILHRESARRKEGRRYQGTKQGVFSSREDYDYKDHKSHETPSFFVTPSYPRKVSLKTFDNSISASTEGSVRRNYHLRGDRKLESVGNGVREGSARRPVGGGGGNTFDVDRGGKNTFGGSVQASGGRESAFSSRKSDSGFSVGTQKPTGSSFSRDRASQRVQDQNRFSSNLQGNSAGLTRTSFSGKSGQFTQNGGQSKENERQSFVVQQQPSGPGQTSFDSISEQSLSRSDSFGSRLQDKQTSSRQNVFSTNAPTTSENRGQAFGGRFGHSGFGRTTQKSTTVADYNSFSGSVQEQPENRDQFTTTSQQRFDGAENRFTASTQQTFRESNQNKFSRQGSFNGFGQSGFGRTTPKSTTANDYNPFTREKSTSRGQFSSSSQQSFGGLQNKFTSSTQETFGEQNKFSQSGFNVFNQNGFGRTTPRSTTANVYNPFKNRGQFTPSTRQGFSGFTSSTQQTFKEDQNKFNLQDTSRRTQFNAFGSKTGTGRQHFGGSADNIKFSISSNGKADEYSKSSFAPQPTEGGTEQNRFDVNALSTSGGFDQTTSRFGLTFRGRDYTTESGRVSVTTSGEMQEPQETASFVKNFRNNIPTNNGKQATTNLYPNHRATYSEIKDPRLYQERPQNKLPNKPFYGSSISPQVLTTIPISAQTSSPRVTTEENVRTDQFSYDFGLRSNTATAKQPSLQGGSGQFTTESNLPTNRFSYDFGTRSDALTTKQSSFEGTNGRFTDSKSEDIRTSSTSNRFGFGVQRNEQTTTEYSKTNVPVYDKVDEVDISLNSVSSTLQPDFSNAGKSKISESPVSQTLSYEKQANKFGSKTSTPSVGISTYSYTKVPTTERPRTDSSLINLDIIPSTVLPGFDINAEGDRAGKAFNYESPKTQIIQTPKPTYDKSFLDFSRNKYDGSALSSNTYSNDKLFTSSPVVSHTSSDCGGKSIFPSSLSNTFRASTTANPLTIDTNRTPFIINGESKKTTPSEVKINISNRHRTSSDCGGKSTYPSSTSITFKASTTANPLTIETSKAPFIINAESQKTTPVENKVRVKVNTKNCHRTSSNCGGKSTYPSSLSNTFIASTTANPLTIETNRAQFIINEESHKTIPVENKGVVNININNESYPVPTTENINVRTDAAQFSTLSGRGEFDTTRVAGADRDGLEVTINDQVFTTNTLPTATQTIAFDIYGQTHSTPAPGFFYSRQNEFGFTATTATPSGETTPNGPFTSTILQPKPFSFPTQLPPISLNSVTPTSDMYGVTLSDRSGVSTVDDFAKQTTKSQIPSYRVSSASPFSPASKIDNEINIKTPLPTLPTPYTTEPTSLQHFTIDENVSNMINTLVEVARQRIKSNNSEESYNTPRPGLIVPPSAGPQTLHTLAIYFANALDNLTASAPREVDETTDSEGETDSPIVHIDNEELIKSLLTQMTLDNYDGLFKNKDLPTTVEPTIDFRTGADDAENDLLREDTKYPAEGTTVRQLARVFTEALSAYLEDPDTFKKVLHDVRPKEPSQLEGESETEEDEVLNYSDSDLKHDHPHLPIRPTGTPVNPTWSYILAFNKTLNTGDTLESRNSLGPENENLQSADSQSFVSQFNRVTKDYKTPPPPKNYDESLQTTTESFTNLEEERSGKALPENHWTSSLDATKLWQTTLSVNPATLNDNFDSTRADTSNTALPGFTSSEENSSESSELSTVSEIQYELRALPKLELNSTQVHGLLIDFMNSTKSEGGPRLMKLLNKLNISQDEFLTKMKEIEGNPLTRRLILLLISECSTDKNNDLEIGATTTSIYDDIKTTHQGNAEAEFTGTTEINLFKQIVHPSLDDDDEDTRALKLLNSLYVIASKFGK